MLDIVIVFFLLGLLAGIAKSDLKVPQAAYDTLSILLMLTLGLKGGFALHGQLNRALLPDILLVILLGATIPLLLYPILRKWVLLSSANSASVAAHYGSASAGTFAVALAYAEINNLAVAPQTTLYLVLLELPAIVTAIVLHRKITHNQQSISSIWHEALTSRGVLLLTGGVVIGCWYGPDASSEVTSVFLGGFKALLALFLLEMGRCTAKYLYPLPVRHWRLMTFALVTPCCLAFLGILMGCLLNLPQGSIFIFGTLVASASYIAAPAAISRAIKDADIGLAMLSALGVTFPFNILFGIPLYYQLTLWLS